MIRVFSRRVPEGADAEYEARFHGANAGESALLPVAVTSIRATLTTKDGTVINGRQQQEVLNAAGGTFGDDGVFVLMLSGETDNARVTTTPLEERRLTLVVTYARVGGGTGQFTREIRYVLYDLAQIPLE